MSFRLLVLLLFSFVYMPIYAHAIGESYSSQKFIEIYGTDQIDGKIEKVIHLENKKGNFFMVLSKKIVTIQQAEVDHIYAYGFNVVNGVLKEEWRFKDFGNPIYWPRFYLNDSGILDGEADDVPKYVIAYFGSSDGLDAKPLKIITYIEGVKYKATALYPAGNEGDVYHIIYDQNWKKMPKSMQIYVSNLFRKLKPFNLFEYK